MEKLSRLFRVLYVAVAFASATALHNCGNTDAFAQTRDPNAIPYTAQQQDTRTISDVSALTVRVNDLSDRISTIQGIGAGALGVLGALQLLGLIATIKTRKADD